MSDKNPESLKRIDIQQNSENDDHVDTDIEIEKNDVVEDSNGIKESQLNNEELENLVVQYT